MFQNYEGEHFTQPPIVSNQVYPILQAHIRKLGSQYDTFVHVIH